MPWEYTDEYYTEYTRTTWNESAAPYVDLMRRMSPLRSELVSRLNPQPGERILDMGTGPGEPALTIAVAVGPRGHVTGIDLSEKMIELAGNGSKIRGVSNIDFRVMDCSKLEFGDASFDGVTSAFGFQIFTNPEKAAAQAHRVLKPGGRIVTTVWSTGDKVPLLDVIIAPMLEDAEPDENGYLPTPYETGGPGEMVAFLEGAGFRNASERRVTHTFHFEDADTYLNLILKATPIGHSLSEESSEVQEEVLRKTRENLRKWSTAGGIDLPAECVVVGSERP